jgi:hypothetical protein
MSDEIQIRAVSLRPPAAVPESDADQGQRERLVVAVEVKSTADRPLHVWTSRRAYDYDAATKTLVVSMADTAAPSSDVELISDHPRVPRQTTVAPGAEATLEVPVPTTIRRRGPSQGLGMGFVEEPVGPIDHVELHIQYADVPFQAIVGEAPRSQRERLRSHGAIASATLTPRKEQ